MMLRQGVLEAARVPAHETNGGEASATSALFAHDAAHVKRVAQQGDVMNVAMRTRNVNVNR